MYNPTDGTNPQPQIIFVAVRDGAKPAARPIIFTRNVEKAHRWFSAQTSTTGPIETDSGGNHFFAFRDLDGNQIEVCLDPELQRKSNVHS